jgi:hypothetical protein
VLLGTVLWPQVAAACTSPGCRVLKGKGKGEVAYQVLQTVEHQARSKWPSQWRMSSFSDCAVDPELEGCRVRRGLILDPVESASHAGLRPSMPGSESQRLFTPRSESRRMRQGRQARSSRRWRLTARRDGRGGQGRAASVG